MCESTDVFQVLCLLYLPKGALVYVSKSMSSSFSRRLDLLSLESGLIPQTQLRLCNDFTSSRRAPVVASPNTWIHDVIRGLDSLRKTIFESPQFVATCNPGLQLHSVLVDHFMVRLVHSMMILGIRHSL
jgi:hypothetical protein